MGFGIEIEIGSTRLLTGLTLRIALASGASIGGSGEGEGQYESRDYSIDFSSISVAGYGESFPGNNFLISILSAGCGRNNESDLFRSLDFDS